MAKQLKEPDLTVKANSGWCLWHTQEVFKVPHYYPSAWAAWQATTLRHYGTDLPDAAVPVWFSHFGKYGTPPTFGNWGHVVAWIPARQAYLSVIGVGFGLQWFNSIAHIERYFNAVYVGWSEDISGIKVIDLQGDEMIDKADTYFVQAAAEAILGRTAAGDQNLLNNVGRPKNDVLDTIRSYPEALVRRDKADQFQQVLNENSELKKKIAELEQGVEFEVVSDPVYRRKSTTK